MVRAGLNRPGEHVALVPREYDVVVGSRLSEALTTNLMDQVKQPSNVLSVRKF